MITFTLYISVGVISGFIAGLLGVGGGIVIVPALLFTFSFLQFPPDFIMHMAIATSLACIIPTAISSARTHHHHKAILWPVMHFFIPMIVIGAIIGAFLASKLDGDFLKRIFAFFTFLVSLQMIFRITPHKSTSKLGPAKLTTSGVLIAVISSLLGIGGGTLIVPLLVWNGVDIKKAVGTSALCGIPIAIAGSVSYVITGMSEAYMPAGSFGFIYLPALLGILPTSIIFAQIGARMTHRVSINWLRLIFAFFLLSISLHMFLG